jgi:hypothetical protein
MGIQNDRAHAAAGRNGSLLGRVRSAHDHEIDESEESEPRKTASREQHSLDEAENNLKAQAGDRLQRRMIGCAREILDGQLDSSEKVRGEIIEAVVETRYDGLADQQRRTELVEALEATLGADPAFRAEVENMLIHAARKLGRVKGG